MGAQLLALWERILGYFRPEEEDEGHQCPEGICDGSGWVEKMEYECNDSTGYNTIVNGTGEMERCACSLDGDDCDYDDL